MSQNCNCNCEHGKPTVTLPVSGLSIQVDAEALSACQCQGGVPGEGRIRVTEDLHIYVDGKRAESGDGLTPETAVKTYAEAVRAASRYDGCNEFNLIFNFADSTEGDNYGDITITAGGYSTFNGFVITGESIAAAFGAIQVLASAKVTIMNIKLNYIGAEGNTSVTLEGNIVISPLADTHCIHARSGSEIALKADIIVLGGSCYAVLCGFHCGNTMCYGGSISVMNGLTCTSAFACAYNCGVVNTSGIPITGTASGRRYIVQRNGVIHVHGKGANYFPGNVGGTADTGGIYIS